MHLLCAGVLGALVGTPHSVLRPPAAHVRVCSAPLCAAEAAAVDAPVVVLGATGYIGKAVVRELVARGRPTIAFTRPGATIPPEFDGATIVEGDVEQDTDGRLRTAITGASGVISCISSRSGSRDEVWRVDYGASKLALDLLGEYGAKDASYVLLSAICVKTPVLQLHRAKLAVEKDLSEGSVPYAIVRPSAYFKSISAQVPSVVAGKPYVLFGDGTHTKCNGIGQGDLANCLVDALIDAPQVNGVIEIGGPEAPISPLEQSQIIFREAGLEPKYLYVPLNWLDNIVNAFEFFERRWPELAGDGAESARIARFYATEDMIGPSVPKYGTEKVGDFYSGAVTRSQEAGDESLGLPASSILASVLLNGFPAAMLIAATLAVCSATFDGALSVAPPQWAASTMLASSNVLSEAMIWLNDAGQLTGN